MQKTMKTRYVKKFANGYMPCAFKCTREIVIMINIIF